MLTHGPALDEPIELVRYYADLLATYPFTEDLGEIEIRGSAHRRWVEKEAGGGRLGDRRVQLPDAARAGQAGSGARRRMHRRAQGRAGHAAAWPWRWAS